MTQLRFALTVILVVGTALAQNQDCRQPWMSSEGPAFCPWEQEPPLPEARTYHAVAAADKNIYVLGGFRYDAATRQLVYYDTVLHSSIDNTGRLGKWNSESSFKTARSGAAAATVGKCIFLSGGSSSTPVSQTYYDDLQYARIGHDGTLSAWTTSPHRLQVARSNHSLVAVTTDQGTFLNAIAGVTQIGADTVHLDSVEIAKVEADCGIGPWRAGQYHLKGGRSSPQAVVLVENVVVIGGWGDLDTIDVYNDVQSSPARLDGSPSPWRISPSRLPTGIYGHGTLLVDTGNHSAPWLLLSVAGQPGTGAYASWISYAYVLPAKSVADTIGAWRIAGTGSLPTGRAGLSVAQYGSRLYVIGGNDANDQYLRDVLSARFDIGEP